VSDSHDSQSHDAPWTIAARFCFHCGASVGAGDLYCSVCGASVHPVSAPSQLAFPNQPAPVAPYSGWWRRVGAQLLDTVAILVLMGIAVGISAGASTAVGNAVPVIVGLIAALVIWCGYFVYFHGTSGQTWGKRALGIRVADDRTGEPIGYGRAFGRWAGLVIVFGWFGALLVVVPYLNLLWPLWDKQHQAWHDKLVSSSVYRSRV
jgi:uncharacterized RDD family membrane protein YckC